jgi:hypothetical protein
MRDPGRGLKRPRRGAGAKVELPNRFLQLLREKHLLTPIDRR